MVITTITTTIVRNKTKVLLFLGGELLAERWTDKGATG